MTRSFVRLNSPLLSYAKRRILERRLLEYLVTITRGRIVQTKLSEMRFIQRARRRINRRALRDAVQKVRLSSFTYASGVESGVWLGYGEV